MSAGAWEPESGPQRRDAGASQIGFHAGAWEPENISKSKGLDSKAYLKVWTPMLNLMAVTRQRGNQKNPVRQNI